jgi:hypothetical protein
MEQWNTGIMGFQEGVIIPFFQHSIIPVCFWQKGNGRVILTRHALDILGTNESVYQ